MCKPPLLPTSARASLVPSERESRRSARLHGWDEPDKLLEQSPHSLPDLKGHGAYDPDLISLTISEQTRRQEE